jgi:hypothetical protein
LIFEVRRKAGEFFQDEASMDRMNGNAALVGSSNSLVTFATGIAQQEREDIQDVLLYADLFASQFRSQKKDWHSWMHVYRERLAARGFKRESVIVGDSEVLSSVDDLTQATFKIIGPWAGGQLADFVRRSFDALGINQMVNAFFRGNLDSGLLGSFQVIPCETTASGDISVLLCGLYLSSDEYSQGRRRLIFHFKGGGYAFDRGAYARHRSAVSDYLSDKARASISGLTV